MEISAKIVPVFQTFSELKKKKSKTTKQGSETDRKLAQLPECRVWFQMSVFKF